MATLDAAFVRESLGRLSAAKANVFGAKFGHRFLLNSPLTEADVVTFERRHNVCLPRDYRHFLTAIGNGGAGPFWGVFPLGMMDGLGDRLETWSEADGFIGTLSKPFPFTDTWNDLLGKPPLELAQTDADEYERKFDHFEASYFDSSHVDGAIPICHKGCALRIWLVLTGRQAGCLWYDGRTDFTGLMPLRLVNGCAATFSSWYSEWLEDALQQTKLAGRQQT